jgi:subtilisin family serine protease
LGVAATGYDDAVADYSNYGAHVSVAAPGGGGSGDDIYSTEPAGGYGYNMGTSMATPHVSGLAALLVARYPTYSPDQVASAILDNALDLETPGWDEHSGCGRIDASGALSNGALAAEPVCLDGVVSWAQTGQHPITDAPFAAGEIVVRFRPHAAATSLPRGYRANAEFLPSLGAWRLRVSVGQERTILARLRADPEVLHADLNYLVFAQD